MTPPGWPPRARRAPLAFVIALFGVLGALVLAGGLTALLAGRMVDVAADSAPTVPAAEAPAREAGELAAKADPRQAVHLVPGFTGLGAPWWDAEARGAIFGLTREAGRAELARAALESVAFQTADLMDAMREDMGDAGLGLVAGVLRVDGGMSASDWTMQVLADMLDVPVDRPHSLETTARGAAYLAGLDAGLYPEPDAFAAGWQAERRFTPHGDAPDRARRLAGWRDAVRRSRKA